MLHRHGIFGTERFAERVPEMRRVLERLHHTGENRFTPGRSGTSVSTSQCAAVGERRRNITGVAPTTKERRDK